MTQAYNLSQLANNLNPNGQLDATDGLVNAVPLANGGTAAATAAAARTNLNVPARDGTDATGTWPINITGSAGSVAALATTNWIVTQVGTDLVFEYNGVTVAKITSTGVITAQP